MRNKTTSLILCILFGWLGIHRFYLGYTLYGFLQLISFGGFGLWWFIDFILIATGNLKEKNFSNNNFSNNTIKITEISEEERNRIYDEYELNHIEKNNFKRMKLFEVAGSNHYKISYILKDNDVLDLIHENDNLYNKRAIGIYSKYGKIGHISDSDLDYAHSLLEKGCNKAHVCSVKIYEYTNYPNKIFVKISVPFPYKSK